MNSSFGHYSTTSFESSKGKQKIYVKDLVQQDSAKIRMIVFHDVLNYHASYLHMAEYFKNQLNFPMNFTWMDFKGFGLSTGKRYHLDNYLELILDISKLIELKSIENTQLGIDKNIILASGMGATLAISYLLSNRTNRNVDGLICVNPLFGLSNFLEKKYLYLLRPQGALLKNILAKINISGGDLYQDSNLATKWETDVLNPKKLSLGLVHQIDECGKRIRSESYYMDIPGLYLVSDNDMLTKKKWTQSFLLGLNDNLKKIKYFKTRQHDLLNGTIKCDVFEEIYNWITTLGSKR